LISTTCGGALWGLFSLAKAGVILLERQDNSYGQIELELELELEQDNTTDKSRLMKALDVVNQRFRKGMLHLTSAGMIGDKRIWSMKQERRTPGYTTRWEDILEVRA
jgi:DNA polymerase V